MKPMITNGGSHPADKWADHAVETILGLVEISEDSTSPEAANARQAKRDIRHALFEIMNSAIDSAQKAEQSLPKHVKTADAALSHAFTLQIDDAMLDGVLAKVTRSFSKTPFSSHFAQSNTQAVLRNIIGQCIADAIHIERRYHHDRLMAAAKGA
jgi:hypothetical protein